LECVEVTGQARGLVKLEDKAVEIYDIIYTASFSPFPSYAIVSDPRHVLSFVDSFLLLLATFQAYNDSVPHLQIDTIPVACFRLCHTYLHLHIAYSCTHNISLAYATSHCLRRLFS